MTLVIYFVFGTDPEEKMKRYEIKNT